MNPAALHQLDVDQIHCLHMEQFYGILRGKHAFIGHDFGMNIVMNPFHPCKVTCLHRLFHEFDIQAHVLEPADCANRLVSSPALIGIKP